MSFNNQAIKFFGEENKTMGLESSWKGVNDQQGKLQTYLDFQLVKRWVFDKLGLENSDFCVLDVGAGKGRMTRCFAPNCSKVVSIEPYEFFCKFLDEIASYLPNVDVYNTTLFEYADTNGEKGKFDLIYVSGVTPYLDDIELDSFFVRVKNLLSGKGHLVIRELGSVGNTVYCSAQINRSHEQIISAAGNYGLECVKWACAYPPFLFEWLRNRHPNAVTDFLYQFTLKPSFYQIWALLARLNISTKWKLPRGISRDYYVYLFKHI